jgi:hypothetical protein
MDEPSILVRIWDFFYAVIRHWIAWITGFVFVIERAIEFFSPWVFKRIDAKYPKDLRRRVLLTICALGFIVASFEAFDDKATQLRELEKQVLTNSRQIMHVTSGADFADNDTTNKLFVVATVPGKPTMIELTKSPRVGQTITISDEGGNANSSPISVLGNSNKIIGMDKYTLNVNHGSVRFTYTGSAWIVD